MNYYQRHKGLVITLAVILIVILALWLSGFRIWVTASNPGPLPEQQAAAAGAGRQAPALGSTLGGVSLVGGNQWTLSGGWSNGPTVSVSISFGSSSSGSSGIGAVGSQSPYGGIVGGPPSGTSGNSNGGSTRTCTGDKKTCDALVNQN